MEQENEQKKYLNKENKSSIPSVLSGNEKFNGILQSRSVGNKT